MLGQHTKSLAPSSILNERDVMFHGDIDASLRLRL
jgi:hypothetical protein